MINVLITGSGAPGARGIIKMFRKTYKVDKIVGVDINPFVATKIYLDKFFQIPKPSDENFINKIIEISSKEKINLIVPIVTKELDIFSKNIDLFNSLNINILIPNEKTLSIANNKLKLLELLNKNDIRVPKYFVIKNGNDFDKYSNLLGYPNRPICIKPPVSNGSRGFRIISASINKVDLFLNEKPNSTYISYQEIRDLLETGDLPEMILMEYLGGSEYSLDVFSDKGEVIVAIPRLREEMKAGISTRNFIHKKTDLIEYSKQIVKAFNYTGFLGIQFKYNDTEIPYILEVNPRLQGTTVASLSTGINFAELIIDSFNNELKKDYIVKWNIRMIRHWEEVYYDSAGHAFTL